MRDRLADIEIRSGNERSSIADLGNDLFLGTVSQVKPDVDFGRLYPLQVLVGFGSPRAPPSRDHARNAQQKSLQGRAEAIGVLQARARHRHGADRQTALVQLGQEPPPYILQARQRSRDQQERDAQDHSRMVQTPAQDRLIESPQPTDQDPLSNL